MRYALFVVWKLYTCRYATQQTEHFWPPLRYPTPLCFSQLPYLRTKYNRRKVPLLRSKTGSLCISPQKQPMCNSFKFTRKRKLGSFARLNPNCKLIQRRNASARQSRQLREAQRQSNLTIFIMHPSCHCPTWSGNLLSEIHDKIFSFLLAGANLMIRFVTFTWSE